MANIQLGEFAVNEIRKSMENLSGKAAKTQALILAERHRVSWQHIYKKTKDLRPEHKIRSDKGKRTFELIEGTDVWKAFEFVTVDKYEPWQALKTAEIRGFTNLPSLATFQTLLRENNVSKKQQNKNRRAYRRWASDTPGEIFQCDVTGLKERWFDLSTRKILKIAETEINRNHPNTDKNLVRVWQVLLSDDCSRRRFLRYVAKDKLTSDDIVRFLVEAFTVLGVPRKLYTDNGGEFQGRLKNAERILNAITQHDGGYTHLRHKPHNAQATGKVEVGHKWAEKCDRFIGTMIREGRKDEITPELLNDIFAVNACIYYNEVSICRPLGQTPLARWDASTAAVRIIERELLESALLSDEFQALLDASMTIAHKGQVYKVPSAFVNYTGQKVSVVVPPNIDLILLKLPNETEYHEIEKIVATADVAGEFKQHPESKTQNLVKRAKETRQADLKANKERKKQTGIVEPILFVDVPVEVPETNLLSFPRPQITYTPEEIAAVTQISTSVCLGKPLNYWEAVEIFTDKFADVDEAKDFLLSMFPEMQGNIAASEVETAIENRLEYQQPTRLRAVKQFD